MTLPAPADLGPTAAGRDMGWHGDPWQRHQLRFHDGGQWTEHVADGGFCSLDSAPVADLPRSHPHPVRDAPPDEGAGPRVVPDADHRPATLASELLLLDHRDGRRRALLGPDDQVAGSVEEPAPAWPRRLVGLLVAGPPTAATTLVVREADGTERLRLSRPGRRIEPVVDVRPADGPPATVRASSVRQGIRAEVRSGDDLVGRLEQVGRSRHALRVVDDAGTPLARLAAVWDVPGRRRHLPPGVLLVDRRPPDGGALDPAGGLVLLGALLSAELLLPPPPP
ncbi:DUF2510 domain-containing protein [Iamia sp. SCSIO 61187]|uniref:DUF2510 domain-containing protein n=1 Tax=Iamia sp. SCSIO 61187 TaxID=2722752 RepID=UPI001C630CC5|nr:DUF2510 domain-containing protein [Iamia sp. SCSIO 61187]QYG91617.1 DUF2510 domain-containing protein [Iamia sp. SCSIO 61187]